MLILADLHLTDKKRDLYRWHVLDNFISEICEQHGERNVLILGDLTDSKDHHSARLVNDIVGYLWELSKEYNIYVLKGNHDYIDPENAYFRFIDYIGEAVTYISHPTTIMIENKVCLFLPHSRSPIETWEESSSFQKYAMQADYIFMHQSVIGSIASNGYEMEHGLDPSYFKQFPGKVYSGDIHVPQTVGPVRYVGSPYSIRFDDAFEPRVLILNRGVETSIGTRLGRRHTIVVEKPEDIFEKGLEAGDQIKVVIVQSDNTPSVEGIKECCDEIGVELCTVVRRKRNLLPLRGRKRRIEQRTPKEVVEDFGKRRGLRKKQVDTGVEIVEDTL